MSGPAPRVPLVDLRAGYARVREELLAEFDAVLSEMQLLLGPRAEAFEREFAEYCGTAHGTALSSGTDALYAALAALGVGPGDEVILPSHTFFASVEAVFRTGALPVLVDVEPETLTLDPARAAEAVTPATRAILPVHLYGHPARMDEIGEIAREHELHIVEDAAQAHGARHRGQRCGSLGDAAAFSFYFTKNLGAYGEGGFVSCADRGVDERLRLLRHHGHASKVEHTLVGGNLRLDELQAAVLRIKLRNLDTDNARRVALAERYCERFAGSPVRPLARRPESEPVYHVFALRVPERDALRAHLDAQGIQTGIHYAVPCHLQPALRAHPHRVGAMKETEAACRELVSLPIYPELTDAQSDFVADKVLEFFGGGGR